MILGKIDKMTLVRRHLLVAALSGGLFFIFWQSRPEWSADMRLWRTFGDTAFVLLAAALAIGPLAKLRLELHSLLPWRREIGIWFALTALTHALLILNGWARWNVLRFLGYEFIPQLGYMARMEPGFGLANLMGLTAVLMALALMATSSDRAVNWLGMSSWKWLHSGAYTIFWLVTLHTAYFLFLHYTASFHKQPPDPNWFRFPALVISLSVVGLQAAAFIKTVRQQKHVDAY